MVAEQRVEAGLAADSRLLERLNRATRTMRSLAGQPAWATAVVEAALVFSGVAALLRVNRETLHLEAFGVRGRESERPRDVGIPLAGAFRTVVDSRDSVVALAEASEISGSLIGLLPGAGRTVLLAPLVAHGKVAAILLAEGNEAGILSGLELVATLGGAALEALAPTGASGLISIGGAEP
ncbi:MAG: hypothetical protein KIT09_31080 [Bryobacteraceae bacterium]|nr:hypothetical protein [Bryobacteraceae bacterium]